MKFVGGEEDYGTKKEFILNYKRLTKPRVYGLVSNIFEVHDCNHRFSIVIADIEEGDDERRGIMLINDESHPGCKLLIDCNIGNKLVEYVRMDVVIFIEVGDEMFQHFSENIRFKEANLEKQESRQYSGDFDEEILECMENKHLPAKITVFMTHVCDEFKCVLDGIRPDYLYTKTSVPLIPDTHFDVTMTLKPQSKVLGFKPQLKGMYDNGKIFPWGAKLTICDNKIYWEIKRLMDNVRYYDILVKLYARYGKNDDYEYIDTVFKKGVGLGYIDVSLDKVDKDLYDECELKLETKLFLHNAIGMIKYNGKPVEPSEKCKVYGKSGESNLRFAKSFSDSDTMREFQMDKYVSDWNVLFFKQFGMHLLVLKHKHSRVDGVKSNVFSIELKGYEGPLTLKISPNIFEQTMVKYGNSIDFECPIDVFATCYMKCVRFDVTIYDIVANPPH